MDCHNFRNKLSSILVNCKRNFALSDFLFVCSLHVKSKRVYRYVCDLKLSLYSYREFFFTFSDGLECKVFVPGQQKEKTLKECSEWELLNLRIDDICSLTDDVITCIKEENPDFKIYVKATVDKALEVKSSFLLILKHPKRGT